MSWDVYIPIKSEPLASLCPYKDPLLTRKSHHENNVTRIHCTDISQRTWSFKGWILVTSKNQYKF